MTHIHHSSTVGFGADHVKRLSIAFAITVTILVAEVVGAVISGSLALLADAGHMLTDAAGLLTAIIAARLMRRPATDRRTWGYRRAEILAATLQAAILFAVGVYILIEGIIRLLEPSAVASGVMVVFGIVGLVGNLIALAVLARTRSSNFNMRAAFLEVLNDTLGSIAVILAAVIIATTEWLRADAVVSLLIAALILPRTVKLLRETVDVLMENAPKGLVLEEVRRHILELPHVLDVHDLHASQIATGLPILTAHVVVDDSCFHDGHSPEILDQLQACVAEHFVVSVEHSTFQIEPHSHLRHERGHHVSRRDPKEIPSCPRVHRMPGGPHAQVHALARGAWSPSCP